MTGKQIIVLRLGHRPERDKRITTHVGLTARAFGAEGLLLASDDRAIADNIESVARRWGGNFYVKNNVNWKKEIQSWKNNGGNVCHLSMYGLNLSDVESDIKNWHKIMIIVGAEKVPPEVYDMADLNVAVGNQPHSEVAAISVTMDRISDYDPLKQEFGDAELSIVPTSRGKKVIDNTNSDNINNN